MKQYFDKENPLIKEIISYKEETKMKEWDFESLVDFLKDKKDYITSYKIDGEQQMFEYEKGTCKFYSKAGRIREDTATTKEVEETLNKAGIEYLKGVGEIFVVDENERAVPYPSAISTLRVPTPESEQRIRFMPFDLLKIDNEEWAGKDYSDKVEKITELFGGGEVVKPVSAFKDDVGDIQEMWKEVTSNVGFEGLVVHVGNEIVKVKPLKTVDAVVYAVLKSEKHPNMMGSLSLALMDTVEVFHPIGQVGTGFSDPERVEWLIWATKNKVGEEGNTIFVDPFADPRIVEVIYMEAPIRTVKGLEWLEDAWQVVPDIPSVTLRQPRFKMVREDKQPNPTDIRVEQVPGLEEALSKQSTLKPETAENVVIPANEYYPEGLTKSRIYSYYKTVGPKLLEFIKDKNLMVWIKTDTAPIVRRKDEGYIQINSLEDLERSNTGRTLEIHPVISEDNKTPFMFVDLDPKKDFPFEDVKRIAANIFHLFEDLDEVTGARIYFSGGRGFHIYGDLKEPADVTATRDAAKELLKDYIESSGDERLTLSITKKDDTMRLDTTLMHKGGTLRSPYSLNMQTGLVNIPVSIEHLPEFKKEEATIDKVLGGLGRSAAKESYSGRFVIQQHFAKKAGPHFDMRLERPAEASLMEYKEKRKLPTPEPMGEEKPKTVLESYTTRNLDKLLEGEKDRILLIQTEPHPIEYISFAGTIPEGYGAGEVNIYDTGSWTLLNQVPGRMTFKLEGEKVKGTFTLLSLEGSKFLLIKKKE